MTAPRKPMALYSGPKECLPIVERELAAHFEVVRTEPEPGPLLSAFRECSVFLDASMKVPIPSGAIDSAPNLRLVATATTGADHIDSAALQKREIPLFTLKGRRDILDRLSAAAELSFGLLLACARRLRGAFRHVEQGGWERMEFPGIMLQGKTLGLIGCGRIGSWMSRYGRAFGMKVLGYDPMLTAFPGEIHGVDLETLLSQSDFISIHVNLTPETRGMLTAEKIRKMKPGCVFINTSRGDLADESALVAALEAGRIAAVGADVVTGEPGIRSNPLWQYAQSHDNVILTPHIGGFCPEAVAQVVEYSARRVLSHFGFS